ncbi:NADPH-dependent FMN reductase [Paenibacillus sp. HB172176]|uniref:NADPH-dependent FMN reductase n=1 Tax=Paenibacillus sp. HB172176 TaxID=2493690 RepID=UPI00143AE524|nr:NADPH-dependent FMN reductase [Paenibacillus sp. HB172176]
MNILAISGSLRKQSSNSALLKSIIAMAPSDMTFITYNGLGELPHFNPDIDVDDGPEAVMAWRSQLNTADGVLICTPEFGNGVPGSLKNALDWIVSSGELMDKPTAVVTASPTLMGGDKAFESILLTLKMINTQIVEGAALKIPQINLKMDKEGNITNAELKQELLLLLEHLKEASQHVLK